MDNNENRYNYNSSCSYSNDNNYINNEYTNYTFNNMSQNYNTYKKTKNGTIGLVGAVAQLVMYCAEIVILVVWFILLLLYGLELIDIILDMIGAIWLIMIATTIPSALFLLLEYKGLKQKMSMFVLVCFRINIIYIFFWSELYFSLDFLGLSF